MSAELPVLVGIDGSRDGLIALGWAASYATLRQAPLHAVYVLDDQPQLAREPTADRTGRRQRGAGRRPPGARADRIHDRVAGGAPRPSGQDPARAGRARPGARRRPARHGWLRRARARIDVPDVYGAQHQGAADRRTRHLGSRGARTPADRGRHRRIARRSGRAALRLRAGRRDERRDSSVSTRSRSARAIRIPMSGPTRAGSPGPTQPTNSWRRRSTAGRPSTPTSPFTTVASPITRCACSPASPSSPTWWWSAGSATPRSPSCGWDRSPAACSTTRTARSPSSITREDSLPWTSSSERAATDQAIRSPDRARRARPGRPGRRHPRLSRAERRRQDHHDPPARRADPPDLRLGGRLRVRRRRPVRRTPAPDRLPARRLRGLPGSHRRAVPGLLRPPVRRCRPGPDRTRWPSVSTSTSVSGSARCPAATGRRSASSRPSCTSPTC